MAGIIQQGNQKKADSLSALRTLVNQETQRNNINKQAELQEEQSKNSIVGLGASMGLQYDVKQGFEHQNPLSTEELTTATDDSQVSTIEGATGEFAHSPVEQSISSEGVSSQAINASPVETVSVEGAVAETAAQEVATETAATTAVEGAIGSSAATTGATAGTTAATTASTTTVAAGGTSAAGGAAAGTEAGSTMGPWGTVIGAAAGLIISEIL